MNVAPSSYWPTINVMRGKSTVVVDSFIIALFLDPEVGGIAKPITSAFEQYLSGLGSGELHFYVDDEGETHPLPDNPGDWVRDYTFGRTEADEVIDLRILDHERPGHRYAARYSHNPRPNSKWPKKRSFVWFRIGQDALSRVGIPGTLAFVDHLCELLPYTYGYASPALSCDNFSKDALPYLRRHPGFDVTSVAAAASDMGDKLLGAYWVNLLGRRLSQALGGALSLREALPPEIRVQEAGQGGLRILVGNEPAVGDVNRQDTLPLYRQLAAVLQPQLQTPKIKYFTNSAGHVDWEAQVAWHERFLR